MKGSYLLILELPADTRILIGKLGEIPFQKGSYGYLGSAFNGLEHRIARHLRSEKKIHWHIDHLLTYATVKYVYIKESTKREECDLAYLFAQTFERIPRFGCSDCRCESHLFYGSADIMRKTATTLQMKPYFLDANP